MSRPVKSISPHRHDFPGLDGLRGVAVLLVVLVHTAEAMNARITHGPVHSFWSAVDPIYAMGGSGVHLFFVLSGFLLFLPFAQRLLGDGRRPSTGNFYKRRALRILPAYYVALVLVWAVFEHDTIRRAAEQFLTHALLIHNISAETFRGLDGPTWTMAVEAQFYVMLPLIGAAAVWLLHRSRRALIVGTGLLLLASPIASAASVALQRHAPGFRGHSDVLAPFTFMSTFACGIVGACVYVVARAGRISDRHQQLIARAGLAAFALIFLGYVLREALDLQRLGDDYYTYAPMMGLCYAGLLMNVVLAPDHVVGRALSRPAIRFLGDISFSVYLLHQPILIGWLVPWAQHASGAWPLLIVAAGLLLVVIPLSTASFYFIERPFLQKKRTAVPVAPPRPPGLQPAATID